ncbi:MAG: PTS transporter subunit EIIC [Bifidobacteriaceae bacterium]|jgi:PTS system cellobiose-specific IIC component|nr:PTS transporter subunit EIIC [Bifidobacteriaceae bacterium]
MEKLTKWLEEHFVPVAAKIGSQKHLVAVRDSFIAILPVTMTGSVAVLFNAIFRDLMAENALNLPAVADAMKWLITIDGDVWWGTVAMFALMFTFSIGYHVARVYNVNEIAGGLISTAAYIVITPQTANATLDIAEGTTLNQSAIDAITASGGTADATSITLGAWGNLNNHYLDANGLFTALIFGLIVTVAFSKMMNANLTIKLPESVPPAVSGAFAAIIPGAIVLFGAGLVNYVLAMIHDANPEIPSAFADLVTKYIQQPFLGASQGLGWVVLITFMIHLLWFFGLHGTNILSAVLDGTYLPALFENNAVWEATKSTADMPYIWTRGSFDAFVWQGGAGCAITILIAILIFSKREDYRTIGKLATPMSAFNICEPVVFGLPIVLNPLFLIPWILVPCVLAVTGWFAAFIGFVPPVYIQVPWIIPPIINGFMATGFAWQAIVISVINLAIGIAIWSVFIIIANRMAAKEFAEGVDAEQVPEQAGA